MTDNSDTELLLGHYQNHRKSYHSPVKNFHSEFQRSSSVSKCFSTFFKRRKAYRCFAFGVLVFLLILVFSMVSFDMYPGLRGFRRHSSSSSASRDGLEFVPRHLAENEILESSHFVGFESILQENFSFNINESDVMVFLHIQKTGGTTFGKHLVQDIDLETPCICHRKTGKKRNPKKPAKKMLRCECFRPNSLQSNWLFSRYSVGWKCGLHADWTELTECVDDYLNTKEGSKARRYFYIALLRDPVERYLSEFRHVQRGATWKGSTHMCHGHPVSKEDVPPCFDEEKGIWENVTLQKFMDCPSNWAANRQARMLADLRMVQCYNMSAISREERDKSILESAKNNLDQLAFFGLTELQNVTQYMFEETFNLNFRVKFEQHQTSQNNSLLSKEVLDRIRSLNKLDIELYDYAKNLFTMRFEAAKAADKDFDEHFNRVHNKVFNFHDIEEEEYEY